MYAKALLAMALVVGVASFCMAAQATSANYILERSVIGSAGNSASSTSYLLGSTLGQSSPIGPSASTNYKVGAGFWYEMVYPTGDVNRDCKVDILDLLAVRNNLNKDPNSSSTAYNCDVNKDGKINVLDLLQVRNNLNKKCE